MQQVGSFANEVSQGVSASAHSLAPTPKAHMRGIRADVGQHKPAVPVVLHQIHTAAEAAAAASGAQTARERLVNTLNTCYSSITCRRRAGQHEEAPANKSRRDDYATGGDGVTVAGVASSESVGSSDSAPLKLKVVDFICIGGGPPHLQTWDVRPTDTIRMLKKKIEEKKCIMVSQQVIVHGKSHKKLNNSRLVADLGDATLHLIHTKSVLLQESYNSSDDPDQSLTEVSESSSDSEILFIGFHESDDGEAASGAMQPAANDMRQQNAARVPSEEPECQISPKCEREVHSVCDTCGKRGCDRCLFLWQDVTICIKCDLHRVFA